MVPVEVRAFGLLALCVIALAAVLLVQWLPAQAPVVGRPLMLAILAVVIALGVVVVVTTRP